MPNGAIVTAGRSGGELLPMTRTSIVILLASVALLAPFRRADADAVVQADRALIISGHPEATRLGTEVLKNGGNAIDALVTTSLALSVAEPGNSGLGGKFVLLYYEAKTKDVTCVVALDAAPLKLDVNRALKFDANQRKRGWVAACVPGLPAALGAAHAKWGTKKWTELVEPAAFLAEQGFKLSPLAAEMMSEFPKDVDAEASRIYAPGGKKLAAGDVFRNADLARTLVQIADGGAKAFYQGETAAKMIGASRASGGAFSDEDFRSYQPRFLRPLKGSYHGNTIYTSPPPLIGGATLLASLGALSATPWPHDAKRSDVPIRPRDARYIDAVGRVLQQIYPEVARAAGDAPDSDDRVARLLEPQNLRDFARRALLADPRNPSTPNDQRAAADRTLDDGDEASTTHLIVIDRFGNIACVTQSLGNHFGSGVVAPGTGVLLNNDMNNFGYGSTTSVNYVAPGKWPRSTIAPTLVLNERTGRPTLVIGAPGGQRIPTGILQVMLDVIDFNRPLDEAIDAPRFHVRRSTSAKEAQNDVDVDSTTDAQVQQQLAERGWTITRREKGEFYFGAVNAAMFLPGGKILGVADQRRTGDAGGG